VSVSFVRASRFLVLLSWCYPTNIVSSCAVSRGQFYLKPHLFLSCPVSRGQFYLKPHLFLSRGTMSQQSMGFDKYRGIRFWREIEGVRLCFRTYGSKNLENEICGNGHKMSPKAEIGYGKWEMRRLNIYTLVAHCRRSNNNNNSNRNH
jgi:hypothetical protein